MAIALAMVDPDVELLAVTATAGCVSGRQATANIQAIVDHIDPPKRPRLGVCQDETAPGELRYAGSDIRWARINGVRGLGDWNPHVVELHNARESPKVLVDFVKEYPNEITLLTLGPLSNVERAAERSRDFLPGLRELVCLGGSVGTGGNVTAAAEFNMYVDPEAARTVLRSPVTKTLVPLDVSAQVQMTFRQYETFLGELREPIRGMFCEMLPHAIRSNHEVFGIEGLSLHEFVALATAIHPELISRVPMAIDVETQGEITRGATIFDRRGARQWQTNIDVATEVDASGILDQLLQFTH